MTTIITQIFIGLLVCSPVLLLGGIFFSVVVIEPIRDRRKRNKWHKLLFDNHDLMTIYSKYCELGETIKEWKNIWAKHYSSIVKLTEQCKDVSLLDEIKMEYKDRIRAEQIEAYRAKTHGTRGEEEQYTLYKAMCDIAQNEHGFVVDDTVLNFTPQFIETAD